MRKIIVGLVLLALILAPLETLGVLKRGTQQVKAAAGSPEVQSLVEKFKVELPSLGGKVSDLLAKLFPNLEVGVKEVR